MISIGISERIGIRVRIGSLSINVRTSMDVYKGVDISILNWLRAILVMLKDTIE